MKVSGFTFLKNAEILGYPFIESISSVLPIVDEFIINVGKSEDDTYELLKQIKSNKIKIIQSEWNEKITDRGFTYAQQKMIAQYNCGGDWAFYVEGDEVYHEKDLDTIRDAMSENLTNTNVEAIAFNFFHFYGNANTILDSPGWYRTEVRIIRNSLRSYSPDSLFWLILDKNKVGRYLKALKLDIYCYHYGWVRSESQMNLKSKKVQKYWGGKPSNVSYSQIDHKILKLFSGVHPKVVQNWLPKAEGLFPVDKSYNLTKKQKKHRIMIFFEKLIGISLSKKHYKKLKN